ncbi:glycine betaine/L-proline ABC transporter ATP-binding protein ProV [Pseudomonas fluorescens]|uniref:Quaternary amine transport ATP-binding protein n=1 Tax=Pseudomonas fluorescens TaxID=294 RepID=A0A423LG05_PSEFL|nr:glycine betaine/L-proline ABC transporter ATP-binding protein ProV [Pseudomonas fluorescens]RON67208.1 glycine betaine/L-proline ABC transporter ATP-binding protein [Pseudomonas fluorescens]
MKSKLEVKNLCKVFGGCPEEAMRLVGEGLERTEIFALTGQSLAVNNASFTVYEGEIFVVMGLSGSGKSTLVRLLNRLIDPTSGQVMFDGVDIATMSETQLRGLRRRHISMVFQSFALMPHLTVLQNVAFGLELAGEPRSMRNQKAQKVLDQVGLGTRSDGFPHELSGGMQQRVGLARALASDPSVLLMDEAFSALDPMIRAEMQDELVKLQQKDKRTIIFISHDIEEAFRIGDRIAIMQDGIVVQVGTKEEIVKQPRNDYVRSFFKNVDVTHVYSALDVSDMPIEAVLNASRSDLQEARAQLLASDHEFGYVVDESRKFLGVVSIESLDVEIQVKGQSNLTSALMAIVPSIPSTTSVCSLYNTLANFQYDLPVVDADGKFRGVISRSRVFELLGRRPIEAEERIAGINEPDTCC